MKIGMIVNNMEVSGGYHKLVIRLAQQLQKKGHSVTTYTLGVDKKKCYPNDINSIEIIELTPKEKQNSKEDKIAILASKLEPDFDAIIIHDGVSLRVIALANIKKSTKVLWMLNNQLHPLDIGQYGATLKEVLLEKQKISIKLRKSLRELGQARLTKKGIKQVNHFLTYDNLNKQLVEKYLKRKAEIVYAGADLSEFSKMSKNRSFEKKASYTLLSVGVFFPHRRYEDLISAADILRKKIENFKVVIVGRQDLQPEYVSDLKDLIERLGIKDKITFKGYVSDAAMTRIYKNSDAFIFINDGYTWGISVFEAVAAKLPVIITNNIGAADLIKDGKSGWVVEPKSPGTVAQAIQEIISDRQRAKKVAETAYKNLLDFVSWEAYANRVLNVISRNN